MTPAPGSPLSATLTQPIERGGRYVFEFGDLYFEVDPALGARITSLKFEGMELLTGPAVDANNFGSTFWPSPQSAWNWPPPAEIDHLPYSGGLRGATVTLQSRIYEPLGLQLTKRFTPDTERLGVLVEYTLTNAGKAPTSVAPWEITRVFPGGLTFYPTGGAPYTNVFVLPETVDALGATWLAYDPAKVKSHQKLFAQGRGGFLAHVESGVLLVKVFEEIQASQAAPGEAQIELYLDGEKRYVEVEQQGAYTELGVGASTTFQVGWYLRKIPDEMAVVPGNADLLALAADLAARAAAP